MAAGGAAIRHYLRLLPLSVILEARYLRFGPIENAPSDGALSKRAEPGFER
jgi:hypothetical protein